MNRNQKLTSAIKVGRVMGKRIKSYVQLHILHSLSMHENEEEKNGDASKTI